jgi:hypothetical protein
MVRDQNNHPGNVPLPAEESGNVRNGSESFRTIPHGSETFGKLPNDSERFGSFPHASERKENHALTVREASRMFETAGVARTERSITNWCQPNRTGVARLDAYFDPNERKYFITPQSVELAIAEEKAKAAKLNEPEEAFGKIPQGSESFRTVPHDAERTERQFPNDSEGRENKELEHQIRDLQITNKAKDIVIEQMQKERNGFIDQMLSANRKVGELENRLSQLGDGRNK